MNDDPASPATVVAVTLGTSEVAMIVALVALLFVLVFLALAETGLTRMTRARATSLFESESKKGKRLAYLVAHPERWLNSLLLVILIVQMVQTALTTLLADRIFDQAWYGVAIGLFFNIVLVFVMTEAVPKTWAVQHSERAVGVATTPVFLLTQFWPLRMVSRLLIGLANWIIPGKGLAAGPFVSEEELLAVADEAAQSESIDAAERALIREVIEFGDTIVREVMVPRTDMVTVTGDFRVADAMEVVLLNGYSRVPVCGEGIDDIVGVVYAKDLMRAERDDREDALVTTLMREPTFVPEAKRVAELLPEMQAQKFHMAIVLDEHGGTAGLVTLEDLIEELVGEIVDEFDVEGPRVEPMANGDIRVDGRLPVDEANEFISGTLPEGDWDTVGGLVFSMLGRVPTEGDTVEVEGYRLQADKVQGRRIVRVRITPVEPESQLEPAGS